MRPLPILALLLVASRVFAQIVPGDTGKPRLEGKILEVTPAEAPPGATVVAKIQLTPPEGWHFYGLNKGTTGVPTEFKVTSGAVRIAAGIKEPPPKKHDEMIGKYHEQYEYHEGATVFEVPLQIDGAAPPGEMAFALSVHHMICKDVCLDPTDLAIEGKVKVMADAGTEAVPAELAKIAVRLMSVEPAKAKMGDTVVAKVEATMPRGWHIYSVKTNAEVVPTSFKVEKGPFRVLSDGVKEPAPKKHTETFSNGNTLEYEFHEGTVVFEVPLEVTGDAVPGPATLQLVMHEMMCADACLPDEDISLSADISILEGGAAKPPPGTSKPPEPPKKKEGAAKFLSFLGLAIVTGLATLVTPCVFPMIPVTISFFTKQSSGGRGGTFSLAAAYGLGIVASYTAIGLIVSALLGARGANEFANNPYVNITIFVVFVVFAFSLFGWFEIVLPGAVTNAVSAQGKSGIAGALLLGLTFSVTAFTCAAPFAASLMAFAVQGQRSWALIGFLVYSTTMAIPFFCLGMFPSLMKKIPRSGGWLNSVKVVMGFVELAASCKFLFAADYAWQWNVVSRSGVLAFWTALFLAAALYLLNFIRFEHDEPRVTLSVPRMLWGVGFASLAFFSASGLFGRHLGWIEAFLPYPEKKMTWFGDAGGGGTGSGSKESGHVEEGSYSQALAEGKAKHRPVFLEFTAAT